MGKGNKVNIAGLGAAALAGGATGSPLNAISGLAAGALGGEADGAAEEEIMQSAVAPEVAQSSTVEATNAVNAASVLEAMNAGNAALPEAMISPVAVALGASAGYGSGHRATPYGGGMGAGLGALLGAGFGH